MLVIALGVCLAFFVFFIGVTVRSNELSASEGIFQYFYGLYKNLALMFPSVEGGAATDEGSLPSGYYKFANYFPAVLKTVVFAAVLVTVMILVVFAIVKASKKLAGKSKASGGKYIISAFAVYVAGAAVMKSFVSASLNMGSVITVSLNGVTIAGIAVCSVMLAAYLFAQFATRGKDMFEPRTLCGVMFAIGGIAAAAAVMALVVAPACQVYKDGSSIGALGNIAWLMLLALRVSTGGAYDEFTADNPEFSAATAMIILAVICTIGAIAAVAAIVKRDCTTFIRKKQSTGIKHIVPNIVLAALCAAVMIFSVLSAHFIHEIIFTDGEQAMENIYMICGAPIAAFAVSLLSVGIAAAKSAVFSRLKDKQ